MWALVLLSQVNRLGGPAAEPSGPGVATVTGWAWRPVSPPVRGPPRPRVLPALSQHSPGPSWRLVLSAGPLGRGHRTRAQGCSRALSSPNAPATPLLLCCRVCDAGGSNPRGAGRLTSFKRHSLSHPAGVMVKAAGTFSTLEASFGDCHLMFHQ